MNMIDDIEGAEMMVNRRTDEQSLYDSDDTLEWMDVGMQPITKSQPQQVFVAAQPSFAIPEATSHLEHSPYCTQMFNTYDTCCNTTNPWSCPDYSIPRFNHPYMMSAHTELFARKVFVGGLPFDSDEDEINATFSRFGPLQVDWPHKSEKKSHVPPKGFVFLIFDHELSVQMLISNCSLEENNYYMNISTPSTHEKAVQIRPWKLSDTDYLPNSSRSLDLHKVVFIGGVPRQMTASDLAKSIEELYGPVCYAGIDLDPDLKYPKGAGRVAFCSLKSYVKAITSHFVVINSGKVEKRVEIKPYLVLDQGCDECLGSKGTCSMDGLCELTRPNIYFCDHLSCLQYYCQSCWTEMHGNAKREDHKPANRESAKSMISRHDPTTKLPQWTLI